MSRRPNVRAARVRSRCPPRRAAPRGSRPPDTGGRRRPGPAPARVLLGSRTPWGGTPREPERSLAPAPHPCARCPGRPGSSPRGRARRPASAQP